MLTFFIIFYCIFAVIWTYFMMTLSVPYIAKIGLDHSNSFIVFLAIIHFIITPISVVLIIISIVTGQKP